MEVRVDNLSPEEVMTRVRELRKAGLVQGHDFDFSYHQATYDNDGWTEVDNKHAKFKFYNKKQGLLYLLKWK